MRWVVAKGWTQPKSERGTFPKTDPENGKVPPMTAQRKIPTHMTADEFIAWPGDGVGGRYQLVDGEVRAMSPASSGHALIQLELGGILRDHLRGIGSKCRAATEPAIAVRVKVDSNVRVPDIGVTCTPHAPDHANFPDPLLLVEIISPGNASETWINVWAYTTIPSVQEILIVQSTRVEAELLRRAGDGSWPDRTQKFGATDQVYLSSLDLRFQLRSAYATTSLG